MNFLKDILLRFGIYIVLALFLIIFAYYKFFKPDSENVILIEGKNGSYYVKFKEFNSKSDIQLVINKILDRPGNRQILIYEGKYKFNEGCDQSVNTLEELMKNITFYQEDENRFMYSNKKCYLEKNW